MCIIKKNEKDLERGIVLLAACVLEQGYKVNLKQ